MSTSMHSGIQAGYWCQHIVVISMQLRVANSHPRTLAPRTSHPQRQKQNIPQSCGRAQTLAITCVVILLLFLIPTRIILWDQAISIAGYCFNIQYCRYSRTGTSNNKAEKRQREFSCDLFFLNNALISYFTETIS